MLCSPQVNVAREGLTLRQGFQAMAAEGSVKAFFRGNGANVAKIAPETAAKFAIYDAYKRHFYADRKPDEIRWYERLLGTRPNARPASPPGRGA